MDNTTKVILTPGGVALEGTPLNIFDLIQITFSAMLQFMEQTVAQCPEAEKEMTKMEIYDYVNLAATNVLNLFAPELEYTPDLTEEAIIAAEDKLIQDKFDALSPDEKEKAKAFMDAYKKRLKDNIPKVQEARAKAETELKNAPIEPFDENEGEDDENDTPTL